jgi:hypothetical protein
MKTLTGELYTGDVIAIAYSNCFYLGIYLGRGQNNSLQYYGLSHADYLLDNYKKGKRVFKLHINSVGENRVIKINYNDLNDEQKVKCSKIYEIINNK